MHEYINLQNKGKSSRHSKLKTTQGGHEPSALKKPSIKMGVGSCHAQTSYGPPLASHTHT